MNDSVDLKVGKPLSAASRYLLLRARAESEWNVISLATHRYQGSSVAIAHVILRPFVVKGVRTLMRRAGEWIRTR